MQIVDRIKAKCKEKGTSMNALEKEFGFRNGNIRRWDEREPGAARVYQVANRLEVSVEYLLTGKEAADLTTEEKQLIEYYRKADERGKRAIVRTAQLETQELQSSTSKIG